ncbi:MAG: hypothetical protein IJV60_08375, partial [Prevotella sp.]|nr:hypothetical protein [Prevotella sp.]
LLRRDLIAFSGLCKIKKMEITDCQAVLKCEFLVFFCPILLFVEKSQVNGAYKKHFATKTPVFVAKCNNIKLLVAIFF